MSLSPVQFGRHMVTLGDRSYPALFHEDDAERRDIHRFVVPAENGSLAHVEHFVDSGRTVVARMEVEDRGPHSTDWIARMRGHRETTPEGAHEIIQGIGSEKVPDDVRRGNAKYMQWHRSGD